jgi:hypothetical protein
VLFYNAVLKVKPHGISGLLNILDLMCQVYAIGRQFGLKNGEEVGSANTNSGYVKAAQEKVHQNSAGA